MGFKRIIKKLKRQEKKMQKLKISRNDWELKYKELEADFQKALVEINRLDKLTDRAFRPDDVLVQGMDNFVNIREVKTILYIGQAISYERIKLILAYYNCEAIGIGDRDEDMWLLADINAVSRKCGKDIRLMNDPLSRIKQYYHPALPTPIQSDLNFTNELFHGER